MTRRQFFVVAATSVGLAPVVVWVGGRDVDGAGASVSFPLSRTDAEWRALLTPAEYRVLRGRATETAGTSPLDHEARRGTFACAGCGNGLFASDAKFDSGTGWPSFYEPLPDAVATAVDRSWFMVRTEVHCARCGGHLGHVFPDGPRPTGLRYCMNGTALRFLPSDPA